MTTGDLVRKMVLGYVTANDTAFHAAVQQFIEEERRKNHHVLAKEIEKILWSKERGLAAPESFTVFKGNRPLDPPKDKEKNSSLVEIHQPTREMDSLVLDELSFAAIQKVLAENRRSDLLRAHGLNPANKLLFWGPPGCGKTAAAEAIANELHMPLALVRFDALISSYLGETASNIRKVFDFARVQPVVLFFDEFDAIGKGRANQDQHGELKRTVNAFLQLLDGFHAETITIAATNHQDAIDPAIWRRFDEVVQFDRPTVEDIHSLLVKRLRNMRQAPDVNLRETSRRLKGLSHADIERVALDALKRTILMHRDILQKDALDAAVKYYLRREGAVTSKKGPKARGHIRKGKDASQD